VRSDNGTEFMCLNSYFLQHGIIHQTSCTGTPQQNGRAERKHRHILNVARALRFQGGLPIKFWGECILTAGYLINLTPSSILQGKTPYEMVHEKPLRYDHLRVFGSLCYAHNQLTKGDKFESRSRKCVFVGYSFGKKGWKLYDLEKNVFFISRDVKFVESDFPFVSLPNSDAPTTQVQSVLFDSCDNILPGPTLLDDSVVHNREGPSMAHNEQTLHEATVPTEDQISVTTPMQNEQCSSYQESQEIESSSINEDAFEAPLGKGHRVKQPSVRLREYVTNTIDMVSP